MSTIRTNAILDSSGGNTATINGIPLRQGVLDPENRIINGSFDFWQRGTSHSTVGYGSADRWAINAVGGTFSLSRSAFTVGTNIGTQTPTYSGLISVSGQTLANHAMTIQQRIEGVSSYSGQTITVLGWVRRVSGTGNMAVSIDQNFGTGGTPTATALGNGQIVTIAGSSWQPFAVTFAVPTISGATLGTNGNDSLTVVFWTSAGSNFTARSGNLGLQTCDIGLWGIHIKLGTHTTAAVDLYKAPELGLELARCQRYYEKSYNLNVIPGTGATAGSNIVSGSTDSGGIMYTTLNFSTPKRGTPSITFYTTSAGISGSWGYARSGVGPATVAMSVTTNYAGQEHCAVQGTVGGAFVSAFFEGHWVADAEL